MPDGTLVNMPDQLSPDQAAKLRQLHADSAPVAAPEVAPSAVMSSQAEEPSMMSKATDIGKEALRVADYGIRSGVFGLPQLAREASNAIAGHLNKSSLVPEVMKKPIPGMKEINQGLDYIMKPNKPQTAAGKKVGDVLASTVGAMTGPGSMLKNATIGTGAGLGAEAAVAGFGDNPVSRIVGALLGGGATGLIAAEKTNRNALAREVLDDVEPEDLLKAQQTQKEFAAKGLPMNLSQAMDKPSNIDTYVNTLANLPQGKETVKTLRAQPGLIAQQLEDQLLNLPGTQRAPHVMANNAQDAATQVFKNLNAERSDIWQKVFDKNVIKDFDEIPESVMLNATQTIRSLAKEYPSNTSEFKLLTELQGRLFDGENFITDPAMLYKGLKSFKDDLKLENLANKGVSTTAAKYTRKVIANMMQGLDPVMKPYNRADEAYSEFTKSVIDPMKKGVIGRIAQKKGALADTEASLAPLTSVLRKGTVPGAPSEILKVEKEFRLANKAEVFQDAVKTQMAEDISKALKSTDDRINPDLASAVREAFGAPQQLDAVSKGTQDKLVGLARSKGIKDEQAYAKGFTNLMQYISKAARRPGSVSGTSAAGISEKAEAGITRSLGQVSILTPIRQPALKWAAYLKDDSLKTMDHLLNSPEGVSTLIILGKQPKMNHTAQTALSTFFAANANVMASKDAESSNSSELLDSNSR